jgi:uncharacterized protein DUF4079
VICYLHPISGGLVVALLAYVASLGFRLRTARRGRAALAAWHARLAPIAYATVLATWVTGAASTLWLRDDLAFASTLHFRTGSLMAALLTGSALTARAMHGGGTTAREIHPWLGAGAVLLAAAHVVAGLRIMP